MNMLFQGIFDTSTTSIINVSDFLLCLLTSLLIGFLFAFAYMYKSRYTKSFILTLALLPSVVCVVIMMVNGNVGTGVAVAGAFSLVRFRSLPGSAKEIVAIFLAMSAGLITGMGYLAYALLFAVILSTVFIFYNCIDFGYEKTTLKYRTLTITIPEDLNYSDVFVPILSKYTSSYELIRIKTTNLGSLFRLTYNIVLKDISLEKQMMDELRCRNGNLEINVSVQENTSVQL